MNPRPFSSAHQAVRYFGCRPCRSGFMIVTETQKIFWSGGLQARSSQGCPKFIVPSKATGASLAGSTLEFRRFKLLSKLRTSGFLLTWNGSRGAKFGYHKCEYCDAGEHPC